MTLRPLEANGEQWLADDVYNYAEAKQVIEEQMISQLAREAHTAGYQFGHWPVFTEEHDRNRLLTVIKVRVWLVPRG